MRRLAALAVIALLGLAARAEEPLYHGPLDHAKAGQWVLYQMANDMRMKHSIVRVEGKTRITIRLDEDLLQWFRKQVHGAGGGSYQTLINAALREHVSTNREPLEATLRRVLREELPRDLKRAAGR